MANPKYLKYLYKTTEHEAFKLLSTIIPNNFKINHIKSHQDDECSYNDLPLTAKLDVQADKISTQYARKPINTHLLTSPFAIYVTNRYIPQNIDSKIRESSHSNIAQEFFTTKIQLDSKINDSNKLGRSFELYPQAFSLQKTIHTKIHSSPPTNRQDSFCE